jgi:hypothetical protein
VAGLVALALLAVCASVLWPRPGRITLENLHRIHEGMTRVEVEAILGPPGDYTTGPCRDSDGVVYNASSTVVMTDAGPVSVVTCDPPRHCFSPIPDPPSEWATDFGFFSVAFDDGLVIAAGVEPCTKVEQGPLANLRWRAERLWPKWFP